MKFVFISRSFFTLLLCALTICAFAHDREAGILNNITVGLHLGSVHSATGYNDFNPGAYIKFQNNVTVGHYYNSNYRSSNYVGYTFAFNNSIDLTAGLITGYQIYKYSPMLIPSYKFLSVIDSVTLRIAFVPRFFGVVQANVINAMMETDF